MEPRHENLSRQACSPDSAGLQHIPEYPSGFQVHCTDTRLHGFRLMLRSSGWFHHTDTAGEVLLPDGWPSDFLFCHIGRFVIYRKILKMFIPFP